MKLMQSCYVKMLDQRFTRKGKEKKKGSKYVDFNKATNILSFNVLQSRYISTCIMLWKIED